MKFSEWKRKAMLVLLRLASNASSEKERNDLTALMDMLHTLRYRDLASFLRYLWAYCQYHGRFDVCRELVREDIEPD